MMPHDIEAQFLQGPEKQSKEIPKYRKSVQYVKQ